MKTTAYLLGLVAVITLLALNLTESIRIRKALCGEYPSLFASVEYRTWRDGVAASDTCWAKQNALLDQGYRVSGFHTEAGQLYMDFAKPDLRFPTISSDEAEARLAKQTTK